jgi:hypothetical protein
LAQEVRVVDGAGLGARVEPKTHRKFTGSSLHYGILNRSA